MNREENTSSHSIIEKYSKSWGLKLFVLGFMALLLGIPILWIGGLVEERQKNFEIASQSVEEMWGGKQEIGTPVLEIPYLYECGDKKSLKTCHNSIFTYPELMNSTINAKTVYRDKGIFKIPLYQSEVDLSFKFTTPSFGHIQKLKNVVWDNAKIHFKVSENRGLLSSPVIQWGTRSATLKINTDPYPPFSNGMSFKSHRLKMALDSEEEFHMKIHVNGSKELKILPLAGQNKIEVISDWAHPSFKGRQLPTHRNISIQGFEASWQISEVNHMIPRQFEGKQSISEDLGVGFLQYIPVSQYTQLDRAIKYAKLFIVLTFIFCFFAEVQSGFKIHFINYALVGASLLMFFVLLLSLAEHLGFMVAYGVAASAIVIQLSVYLRKVLKKSIAAKWTPAFILALYGFLYSILQSEDYALLTGTIGLFVILTVIMFISSRMNWENTGEK